MKIRNHRLTLDDGNALTYLASPLRRVETAGGGARNPAWTRIRARLLGVAVARAAHTEAAYGAALLARDGSQRFA